MRFCGDDPILTYKDSICNTFQPGTYEGGYFQWDGVLLRWLDPECPGDGTRPHGLEECAIGAHVSPLTSAGCELKSQLSQHPHRHHD